MRIVTDLDIPAALAHTHTHTHTQLLGQTTGTTHIHSYWIRFPGSYSLLRVCNGENIIKIGDYKHIVVNKSTGHPLTINNLPVDIGHTPTQPTLVDEVNTF